MVAEFLLHGGMAWAHLGLSRISSLRIVCSYIDPGTGSLVIQLILGILFGGLVALKLFWANVRRFFGRLFSRKS
jgi:hypothetical protein